jgi:hypothetical protein
MQNNPASRRVFYLGNFIHVCALLTPRSRHRKNSTRENGVDRDCSAQ